MFGLRVQIVRIDRPERGRGLFGGVAEEGELPDLRPLEPRVLGKGLKPVGDVRDPVDGKVEGGGRRAEGAWDELMALPFGTDDPEATRVYKPG